jgi:hypothetical protein
MGSEMGNDGWMASSEETGMQVRYGLKAAATVVLAMGILSLAPSTRAASPADTGVGAGPAVIHEPSDGPAAPNVGASSSAEAGVGTPAPGPGLILFGVTAVAYLWYWKPKSRTGRESETATLA